MSDKMTPEQIAALIHDLRTKSTNGNMIAGMVMNQAADLIESQSVEISQMNSNLDRALSGWSGNQESLIYVLDRLEIMTSERDAALARVKVLSDVLQKADHALHDERTSAHRC